MLSQLWRFRYLWHGTPAQVHWVPQVLFTSHLLSQPHILHLLLLKQALHRLDLAAWYVLLFKFFAQLNQTKLLELLAKHFLKLIFVPDSVSVSQVQWVQVQIKSKHLAQLLKLAVSSASNHTVFTILGFVSCVWLN